MTAEKTYQNIIEMLRMYDNAIDGKAADAIIRNPHEWKSNAYFPFYAIAAEMLIDARQQMDKTRGTSTSVLSAVKRMCKTACNTNNPALKGIFRNGDLFVICDGHRAIRLKEDIESLPHIDEKKVLPLDSSKWYPNKWDCEELEILPDVSELKAYIAKCKAVGGRYWNEYAYELIPGLFVNPSYLLDMLQALPNCKVYISGAKSPILFESENGDGIVLPVNPNTAKVA